MTTLYTELPMSKQSFYERLQGKTPWRLAELERLAAQLSVGLNDLLKPPLPGPDDTGIKIVSRHPSAAVRRSASNRPARRPALADVA